MTRRGYAILTVALLINSLLFFVSAWVPTLAPALSGIAAGTCIFSATVLWVTRPRRRD